MNTKNNWRVRTKTIDEMLHEVRDRADFDREYLLRNSERIVEFLIQLLGDQNFKIVLNTLNMLNIIVGIRDQTYRYDKIT